MKIGRRRAPPSASKAEGTPRLLVVKLVPCKKILVNRELQSRLKVYEADVAALGRSTARVGQIHPIVVRPLMDAARKKSIVGPKGEEYELLVGEQRYLARYVATKGEGDIEAKIVDVDDRTAEEMNFDENMFRYSLNLYEIMQRCIRRRERWGESIAEMSTNTDIAERDLSRFFLISDRVAPDLIDRLRIDARGEIVERLEMAARVDGVNAEDRYARQREWWKNEGWLERGRAIANGRRAARRKIAQARRAADMIEINLTLVGPEGSVSLSPKQARAVASALRWTIAPEDFPKPYSDHVP